MTIVRRAMARRAEPATRGFGDSGITLQTVFGGMFTADSEAGASVSIPKAEGLPAVGAAIRRLSRDVGTLPLITSRGPESALVAIPNDPTYRLLRRRWNREMTATVALTTVARHLVGWGQAFIGKDLVALSSGFQEVTSLWPIHPNRVTVIIENGRKIFNVVTDYNGVKQYTSREIIHVLLDSPDGYQGISPIAQHRQAIGHQIALQTFGSKSIANRAVPAGYLRIKKAINDVTKRNQLRQEWDALYRGAANSNRTAILDEDAEFVGVSLPLVDAQFIEQRRYGIVEVAQIFNMPAHKLQGDTGSSLTYTTREGNQLEYLTDALRPVMVAIEDALNGDVWLFPPARKMSCALDDHALLRLDSMTRAKVESIAAAGAPWQRPSEIRAARGLPDDPEFDFVPKQAAGVASAGKGAGDGSSE